MPATPDQKAEMVRLYVEEGLGCKAIAKMFGCTHKVPRAAVEKAGHSMRSMAEGKSLQREQDREHGPNSWMTPEQLEAKRRKRSDARWVRDATRMAMSRWETGRAADERRRQATARERELRHEQLKADPEAMRARWREKYKAQASKARVTKRRYKRNNPEKVKAGTAIRNAVLAGEMKPAREMDCAKCGGAASDYHHHKGYSPENWLNVEPVCRICHVAEHAESA